MKHEVNNNDKLLKVFKHKHFNEIFQNKHKETSSKLSFSFVTDSNA